MDRSLAPAADRSHWRTRLCIPDFIFRSTLVIPDQRTPESASAAIAAHQVNILPASPTFLNLMLLAHAHEAHDCSSIEIIAYGAEAMPQPLLDRIADAFPNAQLQQKFGTSETGASASKAHRGKASSFKSPMPTQNGRSSMTSFGSKHRLESWVT